MTPRSSVAFAACVAASWASNTLAQVILLPRPPAGTAGGRYGRLILGTRAFDHQLFRLGAALRGHVVVAAPNERIGMPIPAGRVYVYGLSPPSLVHALTTPYATSSDRQFGYNVAILYDTDGDRVPDVAVSEHLYTPPGGPNAAGIVHVFSGATGQLRYSLRSPNEAFAINFGLAAITGVPDLDGDGLGDIVIGSPYEFRDEGRIHVFSGADGRLLYSLRPIFACPSPTKDCAFGFQVFGFDDIDGDKFGDFLARSAEVDPSRPNESLLNFYSGVTGKLIRRIYVPRGGSGTLSLLPDLDGDGFFDLALGRYWTDGYRGDARVLSGATGAELYRVTSPNAMPYGQFGGILAGVPDMDSDGLGDILVGASIETVGGRPEYSGAAYLFSGRDGRLLKQLFSPDPRFRGNFGSSVAAIPDANGDGRPELAVSAVGENAFPHIDPGPGRVWVFLSCAADFDFSGAVDSADFFAFLEAFFAARADFNGDGVTNSQDFFDFLAAFFAGCG